MRDSVYEIKALWHSHMWHARVDSHIKKAWVLSNMILVKSLQYVAQPDIYIMIVYSGSVLFNAYTSCKSLIIWNRHEAKPAAILCHAPEPIQFLEVIHSKSQTIGLLSGNFSQDSASL